MLAALHCTAQHQRLCNHPQQFCKAQKLLHDNSRSKLPGNPADVARQLRLARKQSPQHMSSIIDERKKHIRHEPYHAQRNLISALTTRPDPDDGTSLQYFVTITEKYRFMSDQPVLHRHYSCHNAPVMTRQKQPLHLQATTPFHDRRTLAPITHQRTAQALVALSTLQAVKTPRRRRPCAISDVEESCTVCAALTMSGACPTMPAPGPLRNQHD